MRTSYLCVQVEYLLLKVRTLSHRPSPSGARVGLDVSGSEEELLALADCHLWTGCWSDGLQLVSASSDS